MAGLVAVAEAAQRLKNMLHYAGVHDLTTQIEAAVLKLEERLKAIGFD